MRNFLLLLVLAFGALDAQVVDQSFLQRLLTRWRPQTLAYEIGLIGDQQYSAVQTARFPSVIGAMNRENLAFVVHDGDIKSGTTLCDDAMFTDRLRTFSESVHPFLYTPGDNEWTDCHRANNGAFDPLERLAHLRRTFFATAGESLGRRKMQVTAQSEWPAYSMYRENQIWTMGEVVYATVHIIGSNNNKGRTPEADREYEARNTANLAWIRTAFALARDGGFGAVMIIMQADMLFQNLDGAPESDGFDGTIYVLEDEAKAFQRPVVLVHGDNHYFRIDKPLPRGNHGSTVPALTNFTRLETFGPADLHWVRARIIPGSKNVFQFEQEIIAENIGVR